MIKVVPIAALIAGLLSGCGDRSRDQPAGKRAVRAPTTRQPDHGTPGAPLRPGDAAWPGFGRDAAHSGAAAVSGPRTARVRWRRRLEGPVVPGPVVGRDGLVVAASNGGVLHGIDLRTGADRWRLDAHATYGSDLSTTPLITGDGLILWPGPANALIAVDASGRERWRLQFGGEPRSPALTPDGSLVVGDAAGGLTAFARPSAERAPQRRWHLQLGTTSYSSPAVGSDGTVYTTVDRDLVAVRDGMVRWRTSAGDISETSPAITPAGLIVFSANDDVIRALTPAGRPVWSYAIGALTYSSPAVTRDGLVLFGDHLGRVTTLDGATGKLLAQVHGLARTPTLRSVGVWTQPIVDARHDVYFGTRPGHIYGFSARGRRLLDIDTGATVDSYPALAADGTLLVGSESGELWAIGGRW